MAFYGCSCGVLGSAIVALLMLSAPHLVPDTHPQVDLEPDPRDGDSILDNIIDILQYPTSHMCISCALVVCGVFALVSDIIHRKILENRLCVMRGYLAKSLAHLRTLETKREQLETTLKTVQNATAEYNLLLYLLQHNSFPSYVISK